MPPDGDIVEIMEKMHPKCIQQSLREEYGGIDTYGTPVRGIKKERKTALDRQCEIDCTPIVVFGVGENEVPIVAAVEMKFAQAKLRFKL